MGGILVTLILSCVAVTGALMTFVIRTPIRVSGMALKAGGSSRLCASNVPAGDQTARALLGSPTDPGVLKKNPVMSADAP